MWYQWVHVHHAAVLLAQPARIAIMSLFKFFNKKEALLSIDIGATGIKLLEFDLSSEKPLLVNLGFTPISADIFTGNTISKPEVVAEHLSALLETSGIAGKRVVTAVPAPSVITKRITMPRQSLQELSAAIQFEAANFIPHNIEAVRLDFHVLGETKQGQLEVLVVAVKNEVIESYLECLSLSGLEAAVVDVDYFAVQNMFEQIMPESLDKSVALLNVGARYSTINVCCNGASLFTADIPVGGKAFTDYLVEEMSISEEEAEGLKRSSAEAGEASPEVLELLDQKLDFVITEINRQLGFYWNASGAEEGISKIYVTGGGALVPGFLEELKEKTEIEVERLSPLSTFDRGSSLDPKSVTDLSPIMAVCAGLGLRSAGDRDLSAFEE